MKKKILKFKIDSTIKEIYTFDKTTDLKRPLLGANIPAGFPSPAQDYIEGTLDLNEYLVTHPAATYFVRVEGYSMIGAGIFPDDILIVDRSLEPHDKKVVIAVVDGELTVKRLRINENCWQLTAENEEYRSIEITEDMDLVIWGIVTYSIHSL